MAPDNAGALRLGKARAWGCGGTESESECVCVALFQLRGSDVLVPTWIRQIQALLGQVPGSLLTPSSVSERPREN